MAKQASPIRCCNAALLLQHTGPKTTSSTPTTSIRGTHRLEPGNKTPFSLARAGTPVPPERPPALPRIIFQSIGNTCPHNATTTKQIPDGHSRKPHRQVSGGQTGTCCKRFTLPRPGRRQYTALRRGVEARRSRQYQTSQPSNTKTSKAITGIHRRSQTVGPHRRSPNRHHSPGCPEQGARAHASPRAKGGRVARMFRGGLPKKTPDQKRALSHHEAISHLRCGTRGGANDTHIPDHGKQDALPDVL